MKNVAWDSSITEGGEIVTRRSQFMWKDQKRCLWEGTFELTPEFWETHKNIWVKGVLERQQ